MIKRKKIISSYIYIYIVTYMLICRHKNLHARIYPLRNIFITLQAHIYKYTHIYTDIHTYIHISLKVKKLDGNYTRMLRAVLNKSWRQYPTRHQLYGHLAPITKTIQVRRTRRAGHCWRSRDELISDVLLWTLTYGRAKAGRPARTYIQQICEDAGCCPEDQLETMNDREKLRERVRDIRASGTT